MLAESDAIRFAAAARSFSVKQIMEWTLKDWAAGFVAVVALVGGIALTLMRQP